MGVKRDSSRDSVWNHQKCNKDGSLLPSDGRGWGCERDHAGEIRIMIKYMISQYFFNFA